MAPENPIYNICSSATPSARQLVNMRQVRLDLVPRCAVIKVVSVETRCLSRHQGSSTQSLETVRSHIASTHARERIHRLQISLYDSEVGFVASLLIARFRSTVSRDRTLYSTREGPPPLVPRHQHLQVPRCCRSRLIVLRTRTSFAARPIRTPGLTLAF